MRQPDQYYNTKLAGHALNRKLITKNKHLRQCVAINVFYGSGCVLEHCAVLLGSRNGFKRDTVKPHFFYPEISNTPII